jgi:hypothetical protein
MGQGFIFKFSSGYTQGLIGVGLDGIAMFGVKLDSGRGTSGSELLPVHDDRRAAGDYGRAGLAAKLRICATELKVGELLPDIPLLRYDDGRLLPQTFRGAMLDSREIEGLSLQAGQYREVSLRNSSDMQDLSAWAAPGVTSDGFNYVGAEYRFNQQRTRSAPGIRNWRTSTSKATSTCCTASGWGSGHWRPTLATSSTGMMDRRALAISRAAPATLCCRPRTVATPCTWGCRRSVATARGCRCMAAAGGPWATTCSTATSATPTSARGKCATTTILPLWVCLGCWPWCATGMVKMPPRRPAAMARSGERDTEVNYTFQSGALKNLNIRLNNATNRRSFNSDFDQTRLIVSYPLTL